MEHFNKADRIIEDTQKAIDRIKEILEEVDNKLKKD